MPLQLKLPLLMTAVLAVVLTIVILATYATLRRSVLSAAQERLSRATRQIAQVSAATVASQQPRYVAVGNDSAKTLALRRYILGLSLVAFTSNASTYLRQGCNLVPGEKQREFNLVHSDGKREAQKLTLADTLKYATAAAKDFGVATGKEVAFDPKLAQADIRGESDVRPTRARSRRNAAATETVGGTE